MSKAKNGHTSTPIQTPDLEVAGTAYPKFDISPMYVGNCSFAFVCSKKWADLRVDAADSDKRFCETCKTDVHRCYTTDEFARRGRAGECVAIAFIEDHKPSEIMGLPDFDED